MNKIVVRFISMYFGANKSGYCVAFVLKDKETIKKYGFKVRCDNFWSSHILVFKEVLKKLKKLKNELDFNFIDFQTTNKMIVDYIKEIDKLAEKEFKKSRGGKIANAEELKEIWKIFKDMNISYKIKKDKGNELDQDITQMLSDLVEEDDDYNVINLKESYNG